MEPLRWVLLLIGLAIIGLVFAYSRGWIPTPGSIRASLKARAAASRASADDALTEGADQSEAEPEPAPPPEPPLAADSRVVTIRIMPGPSGPFPAEQLILSLRSEGLRHGRFNIFHRMTEDEIGRIRYSVASLIEPGSFDLSNLADSEYRGISMFMVLPAPEDGVALFDEMMQVARNISKVVDGRLVDEQGGALSVQRERYMREEVIEFLRQQAKSAAYESEQEGS